MTSTLDLRRAIDNANHAFTKLPALFCAPLVCVGLATWASNEAVRHMVGRRAAITLNGFVDLLWTAGGYYGAVLVCAMYLRLKGGRTPNLRQAGEVAKYFGLVTHVIRLILRFLFWSALASICLAVVFFISYFIYAFALHAVWGISTPHGVAGGRRGVITYLWIGTQAFLLVVALILSRYAFVLPTIALRRGAYTDLIGESVYRTAPVLGTLCMVNAVEFLLSGILPATVLRIPWLAVAPHAFANNAAHLFVVIFVRCVVTWFVLLKMELTLQVVPEFDAT